jgi:hypothetical protein
MSAPTPITAAQALQTIRNMATGNTPNCVNLDTIDRILAQVHEPAPAISGGAGLLTNKIADWLLNFCPVCWEDERNEDAKKVSAFAYAESLIEDCAAPGPASGAATGAWPFELNDDLRFVLGRPNFWCAPFAHAFRKAGHAIPTNAEEEQAFVLHWLTGLVLKHGENWREVAQAEYKALTPGAAGAQGEVQKGGNQV